MPKKILIIEDEKLLREMYVKKFSDTGYAVVAADDAENGIKMAEKETPDLILLDILLPKQNGLGFLEKLRDNPATSKIQVVAFSNFDEPNARQKAKELGVMDYLIKTNFKPKEIVERVGEYLR